MKNFLALIMKLADESPLSTCGKSIKDAIICCIAGKIVLILELKK